MISFAIETDRLILRDMRNTDLDNMFRLDSSPLVHQYLGNKPFTDKSQSQNYINEVIEDYKRYGISRLVVEEKDTGHFIGWSGLRFYNKKHQYNGNYNFFDVGYRLLPEFWGKGYATESAKASLDYGFNTIGLNVIYGITEKENEASHKVLLKIGLNYTVDFYEDKLKKELRWYELKKIDYEKEMSRV
ncbi:GNAT family N-acetyltransferase [Ichthyenterobacterium sp. W332]|uniref:GNAT family N-acetyltransferase n=1 Tax=Microcosmobacter mediterraneus TaxID=3075607 RepID=A0ABU2YIH5_9FLAO|nr:GNAT family N-acetyltransferase [Ichthyenterobacterium sp. W332]MDT0557973.1 GNAT family N-acetyltransferase [Ichthyenterobacterium sp. W332]